ncbi:MAG: peptidylprolyl isomerase [Rubrivivax sp.]
MTTLLPPPHSTLSQGTGADEDATRRRPGDGSYPAWLREPLLHFLVIGALLFAVDHFLVSREDDSKTIVVGAEVTGEIRQLFKLASQRNPDAAELEALRQRWIDNEVLYREGLAMQVDRGDAAIRDRVIFKALSVIDASVKLPPVDDAQLRAWFESRRAKYEEPARFDFREAVLHGDTSELAVRSFAAALNTDDAGDAKAGLRVFKSRPQLNLAQSYGPDFAALLAAAAPGEWRALPSSGGWRAVRLDALSAPKPAVFAALGNVVLQDWTDFTLAGQRTAAVRAMAGKYNVVTGEAGDSTLAKTP